MSSGGGGTPPVSREALAQFYAKHNPENVGNVDEILVKYEGRHGDLRSGLKEKVRHWVKLVVQRLQLPYHSTGRISSRAHAESGRSTGARANASSTGSIRGPTRTFGATHPCPRAGLAARETALPSSSTSRLAKPARAVRRMARLLARQVPQNRSRRPLERPQLILMLTTPSRGRLAPHLRRSPRLLPLLLPPPRPPRPPSGAVCS